MHARASTCSDEASHFELARRARILAIVNATQCLKSIYSNCKPTKIDSKSCKCPQNNPHVTTSATVKVSWPRELARNVNEGITNIPLYLYWTRAGTNSYSHHFLCQCPCLHHSFCILPRFRFAPNWQKYQSHLATKTWKMADQTTPRDFHHVENK